MNGSPIVGDSWAESYNMIYNEELIRVKLSHKTEPAHSDIQSDRHGRKKPREIKRVTKHNGVNNSRQYKCLKSSMKNKLNM